MTPAARTRLVFATAGAFLLVACSDGEASAPRGETTYAPPSSAPSSFSESPAQDRKPDLSRPQTIVSGLDVPWGLAFLPDGSALVSERDAGDIRQIPAGGGEPKKVAEIRGVDAGGEGGLLGIAVDPDYARNKFVYAYFTASGDNRIVRFTFPDGKQQVILDGIDKARIHNGGRIAFGPDGFLYVGTGDAGDGSAAQDRDDVNGKILRITRDGKPAPGNPFDGSPVWSVGHRNVQGLAWGPDKKMYGIEFGQNTWDEVNVIQPGRNYGWPEVEGKEGNAKYVDPIVQWSTDDASPSGAAVAGDTLYAAGLRGERLWTVPLGGGEPKAEFSGKYGRLRTVAVAPDGALWVTTSNRDGRGDPRDGDDKILRFAAA
ncbi:PQQ-dependent sugar dehydrogenase [Actinoplanes sp. LDG1-06]|uniref:PQQ-dependent sugar dehydrogenase n=1 Tax=Paractinoplanes ovalisporus TaxID=2810368 RepID=A0ABS2ANW9_9ACTN|nr:PQQ-dependent sugar dehydrogenase [Actinoplanes ovalisporus]MBM2621521.1 PQQ-dependent sugar dehydrogenase [Actinoplanes ovalisporus]